MENTFQPYSDPSNLESVRAIGFEIVREVAPDEELSTEKLINKLIKDYEIGKLPSADRSTIQPGGFGNVDLVLLVIIPVVVEVLKELGKELVKQTFNEIKMAIEDDNAIKKKAIVIIEQSVEREYHTITEKVKSGKSKRRQKIVKRTIKTHVKRSLGINS
jgi:hypothetical protein